MRRAVEFCRFIFLAVGLSFCRLPAGDAAEPGFRRFDETVSPNGAYVLAWGWNKGGDLAKLEEWPAEKDNDGGNIENYLVDAKQGRVLGTIPGFEYFRGTVGHENHGDISVGWSMDSREALAIYGGKWSDRALVWIGPATRTFIDVEKTFAGAYRHFLQVKEKRSEPGGISFDSPAILPGPVLVMSGWAQIPKEDPVFHYRLRFQVKIEGQKAQCELVGSRKIPDTEEDASDDAVLNKVYGQLRASLSDAGKAALKEEELAWLKQREAIADELQQGAFTRQRVSNLQARLGK